MTDEQLPTTERLALDLEKALAPQEMIDKARAGFYDDYKSPLAMPQTKLHHDAMAAGLTDIALAVLNGYYDCNQAEADAWFNSEETQAEMREFWTDT